MDCAGHDAIRVSLDLAEITNYGWIPVDERRLFNCIKTMAAYSNEVALNYRLN